MAQVRQSGGLEDLDTCERIAPILSGRHPVVSHAGLTYGAGVLYFHGKTPYHPALNI